MYGFYKRIAESAGVKAYGYLPHIDGAVIKSRRLGLMTAGEISNLREKLDLLALQAEKTVDLDALLSLADTSAPVKYDEIKIPFEAEVTIGIARDSAFCFYYDDNLRLLEKLGARLKYVSPLTDAALTDVDGLYIGGGYPEEYAIRLSENRAFKNAVKTAAENGMPIYAECGGFMYLLETYRDNSGAEYHMCGALTGSSELGKHLCRFGYVELTANDDCLLCKKGDAVRGHEFHYSDSSDNGSAFTVCRPNGREWQAVRSEKNVCAGYPHIHFYSNISFARSFVKACGKYRQGKNNV